MHTINKLRLCCVIGLSVLLGACGGGGGYGGGGGAGSYLGTLHISLTDAPACGYDQVNLTINKVRVHQSASAGDNDSGWQEIVLNPARKINLVTLTNGVLQELGQTALPTGHYTQMRLVLNANGSAAPLANSIVAQGGTSEIALDTPSATQSGIKLINEFDVAANTLVDLVLDFDACKSIVTKGNGGFLLKPVISVIPKTVSGAILGYVALAPGLTAVRISAQQNGVALKSTAPDAAGVFTLSPLAPSGNGYTLVFTADGRSSIAIGEVPVAAGASTVVSSAAAPITFTVSSARSASGTVTPVSAQGSVRATQTFATAGPTVEIAFSGADSTSGAYALALSAGAPLLGKFGAGTLPIALSADSSIAGKYALEATATGYATQTANVDVSAASVVKDFPLLP